MGRAFFSKSLFECIFIDFGFLVDFTPKVMNVSSGISLFGYGLGQREKNFTF